MLNTDVHMCNPFYKGAGDLDSGPNACMSSTFPTEPSQILSLIQNGIKTQLRLRKTKVLNWKNSSGLNFYSQMWKMGGRNGIRVLDQSFI